MESVSFFLGRILGEGQEQQSRERTPKALHRGKSSEDAGGGAEPLCVHRNGAFVWPHRPEGAKSDCSWQLWV